eukprot:jgi/Psemu1/38239/gm1.38239_g
MYSLFNDKSQAQSMQRMRQNERKNAVPASQNVAASNYSITSEYPTARNNYQCVKIMSTFANSIDVNSVSREMLRTMEGATTLCYQAQHHYQQAASVSRNFYCTEFTALFAERDQALNDALREAQNGTVKLQMSFSLIHENLELCQRFPVLISQADSFPIVELERIRCTITSPNRSNEFKVSLYNNLMQFVRKCERISVYQQSLLAAVEIHVESDITYMSPSEEQVGRETEQYPEPPTDPMTAAEMYFQPIPVSFPTHPHVESRRGMVEEHNYDSAFGNSSVALQREEEYEPLPYVNRNDVEDLHYALLVPEVDSSVPTGSVFHRDARRVGNNRTSYEGISDSTLLSDIRVTTPSTTHQEASARRHFSTSKESNPRSGFRLPPKAKAKPNQYLPNNNNNNNNALALALGGRDDFIRRDSHDARFGVYPPFQGGSERGQDTDSASEGRSHPSLESRIFPRRSHSY